MTNQSSSATMMRLAPVMSRFPWQQLFAVTVTSWVITTTAMSATKPTGIALKKTVLKSSAHASHANEPRADPAIVIRPRVDRSLLLLRWSPARKNADAVGSPQENTTPNSQGNTRSKAYSPSTVGPPARATMRLATDTAASAPVCAPRFEIVARLTSPPTLYSRSGPPPRARSSTSQRLCVLAQNRHDAKESPQEPKMQNFLVVGDAGEGQQSGNETSRTRHGGGEPTRETPPHQRRCPKSGRPDEEQQAENSHHAALGERSQEVVMGLIRVRGVLRGENRLGTRRTEAEYAVALEVELKRLHLQFAA